MTTKKYENWKEQANECKNLIENEQYKEAISACSTALKTNPFDEQTRSNLQNAIKYSENEDICTHSFEFDFSLSFAGENREIVENIKNGLERRGASVFYDNDKTVNLLGKNLTSQFEENYGSKAKFMVPLLSKDYAKKDWPLFELRTAKDESKRRRVEFILPVKLDNTNILGINQDMGYIDYSKDGTEKTVDNLIKKLKEFQDFSPCDFFNED